MFIHLADGLFIFSGLRRDNEGENNLYHFRFNSLAEDQ